VIKDQVRRRVVYYRLQTKTEESTRLTDTGLVVELEHLKIKTRLIDEKFASVMGGCFIVTLLVYLLLFIMKR